jgi:transcription initiation factor IIE alpha subunit
MIALQTLFKLYDTGIAQHHRERRRNPYALRLLLVFF